MQLSIHTANPPTGGISSGIAFPHHHPHNSYTEGSTKSCYLQFSLGYITDTYICLRNSAMQKFIP